MELIRIYQSQPVKKVEYCLRLLPKASTFLSIAFSNGPITTLEKRHESDFEHPHTLKIWARLRTSGCTQIRQAHVAHLEEDAERS
jgi:hypothetical protein